MAQSPSIIAGIDIGSSITRVIITEKTPEESYPRVIGFGKSESAGVTKGYIVNERDAFESLQSAISRAEQMAGVSLERAYLAIGGVSLETHKKSAHIVLQKKTVTEKDLNTLRQLVIHEFRTTIKNKTILHTIPVRYYLDGEELFADPVGLSGDELTADYSLVSCLTQHRDGYLSVVSQTGIDIIDTVASPIAASVIALTKRSRVAGTALVDIGADTLSISIFEEDILLHTAVIPCGSKLITNDLALGLQISLENAESIKVNRVSEKISLPKKKIAEIIEARIFDILEIIQKKLSLWGRDRLLPGGITIIGGGSHHENIDTHVRTFLKLPAQVAHCEQLIPSKKILDNGWFCAYGLCLLGDQHPSYRTTGITFQKIIKDTKNSVKDFIEQFLP